MASKRNPPPRRRPARPDRRSILAHPELLEKRTVPATFMVTNTSDSGVGSLRQAILDDNAGPSGPIDFDIPGSGVQTLSPLSPLPTLTSSGESIDGTTQPGYAGKALIDIDGTNAGSSDGLFVTASNVTVVGLQIGDFGLSGIAAVGPLSDLTIQGCYIGVNTTATSAGIQPNGQDGIDLEGVDGGTIGGASSAQGNVIGGNGDAGIELDGETVQPGTTDVTIQGNAIGTNPSGVNNLANGTEGILVFDSAGNTIEGDVVTDNANAGIDITDDGTDLATGNLVVSCTIGCNLDGSLGSGQGTGIIVNSADNTIGGTTAADRNLISGNSNANVLASGSEATGDLIEGNYIGTDVYGTEGSVSFVGVMIANNPGGVTIGGAPGSGAGNLISGNGDDGVHEQNDTGGNTIEGNLIGTDATGENSNSNENDGVDIVDCQGDVIASNIISGNMSNGVEIDDQPGFGATIVGNVIGPDLAGTTAIGNFGGIYVGSGTGVVIGGASAGQGNVISGNSEFGIGIDLNATSTQVLGNLIGTDVTGMSLVGDQPYDLSVSGPSNTVGGAATGDGNVIAGGHDSGIEMDGYGGNVVEGNFIGTNSLGTTGLGNVQGIHVQSAAGNTIGGITTGAGNVISGNSNAGVAVTGAGVAESYDVLIERNLIGLAPGGASTLPNNNGVVISDGSSDNTIGGGASDQANTISGNSSDGILLGGTADSADNVIENNFIGAFSPATAAFGNGGDGIHLRFLSGSGFADVTGTIIGAPGAGNVIGGNGIYGIEIDGSGVDANTVAGNFIGTDAAGDTGLGNTSTGVEILASSGNTVGGVAMGTANVISGNLGSGVITGSGTAGNTIKGNFIGTDPTGMHALANDGAGIDLNAGFDVVVANVISGNALYGIDDDENPTTGALIQGNLIGTNATGMNAVPNHQFGIWAIQGDGTTIGGAAAGQGNTISGNIGDGIFLQDEGSDLIEGNTIGLYPGGAAALRNTGDGIVDESFGDDTIGGTAARAGNLIVGNSQSGIILGTYASNAAEGGGDLLEGNVIGTNAAGYAGIGNDHGGLVIESSNNVIGGAANGAGNVIAGNDGGGILFTEATVDPTGNIVQGNAIGTTFGLVTNLGNFGPAGVVVGSGVTGNTIGGALAADANTISSNYGDGIDLDVESGENVVLNNLIGGPFGNGNGISIVGSSDNVIGEAGAGNTITDNSGEGVEIEPATTYQNVGARTYTSGTYVASATFFSGTAPYGPPTSTQYPDGTPISFDLTDNVPITAGTTGSLTLDLYNLSGNFNYGNYITSVSVNGHAVSLTPIQSTNPFDTVEQYTIPVSVAAGTISSGGKFPGPGRLQPRRLVARRCRRPRIRPTWRSYGGLRQRHPGEFHRHRFDVRPQPRQRATPVSMTPLATTSSARP